MSKKFFKFLCPLVLIFTLSASTVGFKDDQLKYQRVRRAYKEKLEGVKSQLKKHDLAIGEIKIYLRAFKEEKLIELWVTDNSTTKYKLVETFSICKNSGEPGPKRKRGDLQVPEGFYHINRFNPVSSYHLSLGINYPNKSDKILGVKGKLGGDIFIHGECVTIGCLPITNTYIKELYVYCVEAKDNGQTTIPVSIFPAKLDDNKFISLKEKHSSSKDKIGLWEDLKKGYDYFNKNKELPSIGFLKSGRHTVSK